MGQSFEELAPFREAHKLKQQLKRVEQFRQQQATGETISRLTANPDWEVYGRYVERERKRHEESAKNQEAKLLDMVNPLPPHEELKVKMQLAHNRACVEMCDTILGFAKVLIEQGEKAAEQLSLITNG